MLDSRQPAQALASCHYDLLERGLLMRRLAQERIRILFRMRPANSAGANNAAETSRGRQTRRWQNVAATAANLYHASAVTAELAAAALAPTPAMDTNSYSTSDKL